MSLPRYVITLGGKHIAAVTWTPATGMVVTLCHPDADVRYEDTRIPQEQPMHITRIDNDKLELTVDGGTGAAQQWMDRYVRPLCGWYTHDDATGYTHMTPASGYTTDDLWSFIDGGYNRVFGAKTDE